MRVVKVLTAEKIPETDALLKLTVDPGDGEIREVVSGVARYYSPDELVGKNVILVMNLKPTKIRGVVSQGMILAAGKGNKLEVLTTEMPVGAKVK